MKYLVFDFDGTIVDDVDFILGIVKHEIEKRGIVIHKSMEELCQQGVKKTLKELKISKLELFKMLLAMKKKAHKGLFDCSPLEGLEEVIQQLHKKAELFVLSTNKRENVKKYLEKYDLAQYFNSIIEDHSYFGKHSGLNLLKKRFHTEPKETAYIGDEVRDVEAAKKSGMKSVAVLWGIEGERPLRESHPDFVFSRPEELLRLVH